MYLIGQWGFWIRYFRCNCCQDGQPDKDRQEETILRSITPRHFQLILKIKKSLSIKTGNIWTF